MLGCFYCTLPLNLFLFSFCLLRSVSTIAIPSNACRERHKDKIDKLGRKDKDFFFAIMRTAPLPTIGIDCPKWDPRNTKSLSKIMTISDEAFIYCEIHAVSACLH